MTAATLPLAAANLGQIAVNVQDVERATAFYRDVLGLRFLFAAGPTLSFFDCGGIRLMLARPESAEHDHRSSILYFRVADIDAAHAALAAGGVRFAAAPHLIARMPDHELWLADFYDSEDNLLALMAEKPLA